MRRFRAGLGAIVILVLAGLGLSAPADAAPESAGNSRDAGAAGRESVTGSPSARALAQAKSSGRRVEVTSARTETETVFAEPSGHLTAQIYAAPVRVRVGSGWQDIDETLLLGSNGRWAPRASTTRVSMSNGGTTPLVTITEGSTSLSLSWRGSLPKPEVSGSMAVYADVLPGADLAVSVDGGEVRPSLIIKTASAARDPRVRSLQLDARVAGGRLQAEGTGGLRVVNASGATVLSSGPASMLEGGAVNSAAASASAGEAPETQVPLGVSSSALTIASDPTLLDSPETTLPVTVGPSIYVLKSASAWAMVDKQHPDKTYYNWQSQGLASVGYYGESPGGPYVKRHFFTFDTSGVRGARILEASFSVYEGDATTCASSRLNAYLSDDVSPTAQPTWNRQPGLSSRVLSSWTKKYGPDCDQTEGRIEFDVTAGVAKRVDQGRSQTTILLRAADEKTRNGHRRFFGPAEYNFRLNPALYVAYNYPPRAPTPAGMSAPSSEMRCATKAAAATNLNPFIRVDYGDGRRSWRSNRSARLAAQTSDPDGDQLEMAFEMQTERGVPLGRSRTSALYLGDAYVSITDTLGPNGPSEPYSATGLKPHIGLPWGIRNGSVLRWRARAFDQDTAGPYSPWCFIKVDYAPPSTPAITSPDYEDGVPGKRQPTVTFTFASNGASKFFYGFNGIVVNQCPSTTTPTCSVKRGRATVTLVVPSSFSNTLSVDARDRAGNWSERAHFWLRTDS